MLTSSCGFAAEANIPKALDNLAAKYAEATAYFEIITNALRQTKGREEPRVIAEKAKDDAMFYSLLLASEGRTQEMAVKVTNARIEVSKKEMLKEIDSRNENIAILRNKYEEAAIGLIKNPPRELVELVNKKAAEIKEK